MIASSGSMTVLKIKQSTVSISAALEEKWPNSTALLYVTTIDNGDLGHDIPTTYKVKLAVYSNEDCDGENMLSPGWSDSGHWHVTQEAAVGGVVIALLHSEAVNTAYKTRTPTWRTLIH